MSGTVNKRASLPGAAELFRRTHGNPAIEEPPAQEGVTPKVDPRPDVEPTVLPQASGRVRHDQKITVYFSSDELFALEDATLECKRAHGLRVDRGRLVRSAVAMALADLAEHGSESDLLAALRSQ